LLIAFDIFKEMKRNS